MKKLTGMPLAAAMALTLLSGCGGEKKAQLNRYTAKGDMFAVSLPGEWTEDDSWGVDGVLSLERKDGASVLVIGTPKGTPPLAYNTSVNNAEELLAYAEAMLLNREDACKTVLSEGTPAAPGSFKNVIAKEGIMTVAEGSSKVFIQCAETDKACYLFMLSASDRYDHYEKYEKIVPSLKEQMQFEELEIPKKEGLSDTQRWFNACYAVIIAQNGGDVGLLAGFEANSFYKELLAAVLERDWGVTDRKSLEEAIDGLKSGGHNRAALDDLSQIGADGMSRDGLSAAMEKAGIDPEDKIALLAAFDAKAAYGEHAIAAWDQSRIMQLIGWGYIAGYYSYEEAMDESMEAARLIQQTFGSWEDFLNSYLYGYSYWSGGDLADTSSRAYGRKQAYEGLKAQGVYEVDWNLEFTMDWQ